MNIAEFYLEDAIGRRIDLNATSDVSFVHTTGLGVSLSPDTASLGEGFFTLVNTDEEPVNRIVGDLVFKPDAYPRYRDFINWTSRAGELIFVYCPYGANRYYREVQIKQIEKSVRGKWRELSCAATFICLTPWYLPTALNLNFETDPENAMRYEFTFDDNLTYGAASSGAYSVEIPAEGHIPAALNVRYAGASANLQISLTGLDTGTIYGACKISAESLATDIIELNTSKRDSYIKKIASDGAETDLLLAGDVDITSEPFFRAPTSEKSVLSITGLGDLSGVASAKAFYYYRSV